jgi:hypothetical protein
MGDGSNKLVVGTLQKLAIDRATGKLTSAAVEEMGRDAVGEATNKTIKNAFGYGMLFVAFIDTYSKAIAAANLENIRKTVEICPHIGQCEHNRHAMKIAAETTATVWQAPDMYWYFHPQMNYRVRHAVQMYRSTANGGWRIEDRNRPEFRTQDCLACCEAHQGQAD